MPAKSFATKFALFLSLFVCLGCASFAEASPELPSDGTENDIPANLILKNGQVPVTLSEALELVRPGQVVVLGEQHGTLEQAAQQLEVLETLRNQGLRVSVGLEFLTYTDQGKVDQWRKGLLSETDFLQLIQWGQGLPFAAYREQARFPRLANEYLLALNSPRSLTAQIAKVGVDHLTDSEKALLPPAWHLGNAAYQRRFEQLMSDSGHVPASEQLAHYFEAQSTWDETMAWQASEFLLAHPEQVLVITVGEFHAQYGGGLPDRLKSHGLKTVTFSLLNLFSLAPDEQRALVAPSLADGNRADFVWTSRFH